MKWKYKFDKNNELKLYRLYCDVCELKTYDDFLKNSKFIIDCENNCHVTMWNLLTYKHPFDVNTYMRQIRVDLDIHGYTNESYDMANKIDNLLRQKSIIGLQDNQNNIIIYKYIEENYKEYLIPLYISHNNEYSYFPSNDEEIIYIHSPLQFYDLQERYNVELESYKSDLHPSVKCITTQYDGKGYYSIKINIESIYKYSILITKIEDVDSLPLKLKEV